MAEIARVHRRSGKNDTLFFKERADSGQSGLEDRGHERVPGGVLEHLRGRMLVDIADGQSFGVRGIAAAGLDVAVGQDIENVARSPAEVLFEPLLAPRVEEGFSLADRGQIDGRYGHEQGIILDDPMPAAGDELRFQSLGQGLQDRIRFLIPRPSDRDDTGDIRPVPDVGSRCDEQGWLRWVLSMEHIDADAKGAVIASVAQFIQRPPQLQAGLEPTRVRGDHSEQETVGDSAFGQGEEELLIQERLAAGEPDPFDAGLPAGPQELHGRRYRQPDLSPLDRTMGAIQVAVRQGREQDLFRGESGATKGCSFVCHMSRSGAGRPVRSQHFMPPPWSKST